MTSIPRSMRPIAVAATMCALVALSSPATADAAPAATVGEHYVALGDSYAAGIGLEPTTGLPVPGCLQTAANYPHLVADALGLELTDATCSSAETPQLIGKAQKTGDGTAPVQTEALGTDTRVVTITIGGNDFGFIDLAASCIALSRTGPIISENASNCRAGFESAKTSVDERIATDVVGAGTSSASGLTAAFALVREKAPNADVFVVGYPSIMPDAAHTPENGCYRAEIKGSSLATLRIENGFPFTDIDVAYIRSLQQKLDTATADAAKVAGFTYVSALAGTAAHSACQTDGSAYVNGITFTSNSRQQITMPPGSIHPNAAGENYLAQSVIPLIEAALAPAEPEPTAPGETPATFPWLVVVGGIVAVVAVVVVALIIVFAIRRRRTAARR